MGSNVGCSNLEFGVVASVFFWVSTLGVFPSFSNTKRKKKVVDSFDIQGQVDLLRFLSRF